MKITKKITINIENIFTVLMDDDGKGIEIHSIGLYGNSPLRFDDERQEKGFCKKLKSKIDAYFRVKENLIIKANKPHLDSDIIKIDEVVDIVKLSRSTIWRRLKENNFPKPIILGGGTSDNAAKGWKTSDIYEWLSKQN